MAASAAAAWEGALAPRALLPALSVALALGLLEAVHAWALPAQYSSKERHTTRLISFLILAVAVAAGLAIGRAGGQ